MEACRLLGLLWHFRFFCFRYGHVSLKSWQIYQRSDFVAKPNLLLYLKITHGNSRESHTFTIHPVMIPGHVAQHLDTIYIVLCGKYRI